MLIILTLIVYFLIALVLVKPLHSYIATPREKWAAEDWSEEVKDSFADIDKEASIILSSIWPITVPFLVIKEVFIKFKALLRNRIKCVH